MGILTDIWEAQKKWDELDKERKRKRREAKLRKKQLENEEVILDSVLITIKREYTAPSWLCQTKSHSI